MTPFFRLAAPAIAGAFLALSSHAAGTAISPAAPYEFDPVNLRITTDSCTFVPETVSVSSVNGLIRVAHRPNNCLVAGEPRVVDIRLGTLPVGDWRVEVHADGNPAGPNPERLAFSVRGRPQIAVFPPPPRPLADHSGLWFRPAESGWGISIHQSANHVVFAGWYVYDAAGSPTWYFLQDGHWVSSTRWTGSVYRSSGPPFFPGPAFDPARVNVEKVGEGHFDFSQRPGEEGVATFTWTVNGQTASKRITRLLH